MHKILIYLHIIYLLKSSTCFEHYPAHLQGVYVVIVYMQPLVSSLSAGDCLVHRLRKNCTFFLTGAQDSHLQTVTIPEAGYVHLRRRPPNDEQVYYLTFIYSSTCFGCPHAHHQELNNCSSSLWFYRWSVVVVVLETCRGF